MATDRAFPRILRVRQLFNCDAVTDVQQETEAQLSALKLSRRVRAGETVAITAGSRGIANIAEILAAVCRHVKSLGAEPFLVPAMGSHGGAATAGQLELLAGYGITESNLGVPIRATMETVIVGKTDAGVPIHFDQAAREADHVIVCNRIKPHTGFFGPFQSGLFKMLLIGLGNHNGAKIYHQAAAHTPFESVVRSVGAEIINRCNILCGVAIVENSYEQTGAIEAVAPDDFFDAEPRLLKLAEEWLPGLPFRDVDLLIIDQIGKNLSGTGMDTNVVGRKFNNHASTDKDQARVNRILIRSLTPESHGNANGIGMAEYTTQSCVDAVNWEITRLNATTSNHPEAAMIPVVYPSDELAVTTALSTIGWVAPSEARVVQIPDTLHLTECCVGEVFADECDRRRDLEILEGPVPMSFDATGRLRSVLT